MKRCTSRILTVLLLGLGACVAQVEGDTGLEDDGLDGQELASEELGQQSSALAIPQVCGSALAPADVSKPTTVVGTGTPQSCTETVLRAAVAKGGVITFNCGSQPTTIPISAPLVAPWNVSTTIDGANRITIDGQQRTQILRSVHEHFRFNDAVLTVQRLTLRGGRDFGAGYRARDGERLCAWGYGSGGGGAIYTRDVNVRVWGVTFYDNRGPRIGPDVAGGAIYMVGSKSLIVENSKFLDNSASNGGAIGLLHTGATLNNVLFESNRATGTHGNFAGATGCPVFAHEEQGGAGGLGGAFYSDGPNDDRMCGVVMVGNKSGDLGGGVFRSAYWGLLPNVPQQNITWDRCVFEGNYSVRGGGGAAYVNNSLFRITNSKFIGNDSGEGDGGGLKLTGLTIQAQGVEFSNNLAGWGGGVAHWGPGPAGAGSTSTLRFSNNAPNDTVGVFPR